MRRVSIVIPVYNEEAVIPALGKQLGALMKRNERYEFEIILVENGSHDRSYQELLGLHRADPRFKIVRLSRNFTADGGVAAGLKFCAGDCVVLMDADLQDPPEVVDTFLSKWEEGNDVVYGIIHSREQVGLVRRFFNRLFYTVISSVTQGNIPANVTAFRLMDRRVYQQLNLMEEANRFTRGLCSWVGFQQVGVPFHRAGRYGGESKVNFFDLLNEGLDAVFAFSSVPLKAITVFGGLISALCFAFIAFEVAVAAFFGNPFPGYRTLVIINLLMFGLIFIALGIIGEYLARIFDNVKGRPNFILRDYVGFKGLPDSLERRQKAVGGGQSS
jgi:dolichol-phosphate mannosyltransferase